MVDRVWDKYHYQVALASRYCAEILLVEDVEWTDEANVLGKFDAAIEFLTYGREIVNDLIEERKLRWDARPLH